MRKRLVGAVVCLSLLLSMALPALAVETAEVETVTISTVKKFLSFAESCRLDSYSRNMEVTLTADLDLTAVAFDGNPSYSGTLDGY